MIQITRMRLINWYAFNNNTIPIGEFTLIAGNNGNGKSVLLDAVKYALYGDTVFNKSTENKGNRTVCSYTRGLLDATAGTYMRPAEKAPTVYSHIVLEMCDKELEKYFILGTVIETNSGNGTSVQRYVVENMKLDEIEHTYLDGEDTLVYTALELQKKYGLTMYNATDGLSKFMQRTGLRLNTDQLGVFRRKLRSIMAYNPEAKIDQFIRENVLEDKIIDLSKLIATKENIDELSETFVKIDDEIKALDEIVSLYDGLKKAQNNLFKDDVKINYKEFLRCQAVMEKNYNEIEKSKGQMDEDEKQISELSEKEKNLKKERDDAEKNLNNMDCTTAISEAKDRLDESIEKVEQLEKDKKLLDDFQNRISEIMQWLFKNNHSVKNKSVLSSLTSNSYSKVQKSLSVNELKEYLSNQIENYISDNAILKKSLSENEKSQIEVQKRIDECKLRRTSFSQIPNYIYLKEKINKEFEKKGIKSEARFACEYVSAINDETWRNVIEGYLGRRSYTILVEPEYYGIADDVLNLSNCKDVHLFNTKLLMNKNNVVVVEDSVVKLIDTNNPIAKKYFNFLLGRFHAVPINMVRDYENAMSVEGRVSVAMDSYYIDFKKVKYYYLGREAIEKNKEIAEKEMNTLIDGYKNLSDEINNNDSEKSYLETELETFSDYNYDAYNDYNEALKECEIRQNEYDNLVEAQNNNLEWLELSNKVSDINKKLKSFENQLKELNDDLYDQKSNKRRCEENYREAEEKYKEKEIKLNDYKAENISAFTEAIEDYREFLNSGNTGAGGILKDRGRAERHCEECKTKLIAAQSSYNAIWQDQNNHLPISEESPVEYQDRKNKIWVEDRQVITEKLKEQKRKYESIFKNEFVLTILKSCENAKREINQINNELSKLNFKSLYEFDVNYVKDGSYYEKILNYARYLKNKNDCGVVYDQMSFDEGRDSADKQGTELEAEMNRIIEKIISGNDGDKIKQYADYRNYMTYEILITNDILKRAKLSKQTGYNSGAEVQIPYMIILIAALLMIYDDKSNSTRLVFIDEPFAKMDPHNVKTMMGFMKKMNLQVVLCAPDKIDLIGSECQVILPVLRTCPDVMEIGNIEVHDYE